jgi:hypothetical protein
VGAAEAPPPTLVGGEAGIEEPPGQGVGLVDDRLGPGELEG